MKSSDCFDIKDSVKEKIQTCRNLEEVQQLGVIFRNKSDIKKNDYEAGNEESNLKAAYKCFSYIIIKLPSIKDLDRKNLELYLRALHNLGAIDCKFKHYNKAKIKFLLASTLGFKPSANSLSEITKSNFAIKNDERLLIEASKSSNIARVAYRNLKKPLIQLVSLFQKENILGDEIIEMQRFLNSTEIVDEKRKELSRVKLEKKRVQENLSHAILSNPEKFRNYNNLLIKISEKLKENTWSSIDEACHIFASIHSSKGVSALKLEQAKFTKSQLIELERVAHEIKAQVGADDLLIVLGRSPLYFTRMLNALFPEIHILEMPFTLGVLSEKDIDQENVENYKEFMKSKGFNSSFFDSNNPYKEIYILDRTLSGRSIKIFYKLLLELGQNSEILDRVKLIALISETAEINKVNGFETIKINDEMIKISESKHFLHQLYSLGILFYPSQWNKWRELDFNPPLFSRAQIRQDQILEWAKQYK